MTFQNYFFEALFRSGGRNVRGVALKTEIKGGNMEEDEGKVGRRGNGLGARSFIDS